MGIDAPTPEDVPPPPPVGEGALVTELTVYMPRSRACLCGVWLRYNDLVRGVGTTRACNFGSSSKILILINFKIILKLNKN